eukprot:Pgem_evm1s2917
MSEVTTISKSLAGLTGKELFKEEERLRNIKLAVSQNQIFEEHKKTMLEKMRNDKLNSNQGYHAIYA